MPALVVRTKAHRAAIRARRGYEPDAVDKVDAVPPTSIAEAWRFDYRGRGMHDRDRVLYSDAFRRLAQITQVTASESGNVFHNRLGHSLKVAQIGRRLTERLQRIAATGLVTGAAATLIEELDADAVEAGCLAHDLGHPPFGHVAEQELQELTGPSQCQGTRVAPGLPGLFEGNAQSFRIVTQLEQSAGGGGLNLSRQTLETLLKYPWRRAEVDDGTDRREKWGYYETEAKIFEWVCQFTPVAHNEKGQRTLEAEIMDWADDLTYAVHDVEDFYCAGLIPLHLFASIPVDGISVMADARKQFVATMDDVQRGKGKPRFTPDQLAGAVENIAGLRPGAPRGPFDGSDVQRQLLRRFGSGLITDFLSAFTIENGSNGSVVLRIDDDARLQVEALKALVHAFVIQRPSMAEVQYGQRRVIADLFEHYLSAVEGVAGDRRTLPLGYRKRLARCESSDDRMRLVVDLVAGLTEESAYRIHHRLTGRSRTSALT